MRRWDWENPRLPWSGPRLSIVMSCLLYQLPCFNCSFSMYRLLNQEVKERVRSSFYSKLAIIAIYLSLWQLIRYLSLTFFDFDSPLTTTSSLVALLIKAFLDKVKVSKTQPTPSLYHNLSRNISQ